MCVEHRRSAAVLSGLLMSGVFALIATAAHAAEQVFEPGTKHVCVPAASGEGWDCNSGENPPTAPKAPREPRLRSSSEVPAESIAEPAATVPAVTAAPAEPANAGARIEPATAAAPSAAAPERPAQTGTASRSSRSVPNYLLAPEARESTPDAPAQPASVAAEKKPRNAAVADAAPAAKPEPAAAPREAPVNRPAESSDRDTATSTTPPPAPVAAAEDSPRTSATAPTPLAAPATTAAPAGADAARTAESTTARETPAAAAPPATAAAPATASAPSAPAIAPAPAPTIASAESRPVSTSRTLLGAAEFRRLADSRYVIELGSGRSRDAAERSATASAPADGTIYLLALQRDGESWYLAVWGDFDSVESARSARAELLAGGATGVGWPRRAGPLKQELGR